MKLLYYFHQSKSEQQAITKNCLTKHKLMYTEESTQSESLVSGLWLDDYYWLLLNNDHECKSCNNYPTNKLI